MALESRTPAGAGVARQLQQATTGFDFFFAR